MSDPLALLPLAIAAGGGRVDGFESQQLVAAGLTLLQRSVPLVKALSGRRAGILLPNSPHLLVALAASEGRGAVLLDPSATAEQIAEQLSIANAGAVFTVSALTDRVPSQLPHVLLDDMPRTARVVASQATRDVDLGSHFGLALEGDPHATGRDEEALILFAPDGPQPRAAVLSHRNVLAAARAAAAAASNSSDDVVLSLLPPTNGFGLALAVLAPLITGASVITIDSFSPTRTLDLVAAGAITELVGIPETFQVLLAAAAERGPSVWSTDLRRCFCAGPGLPEELQERWLQTTHVELRQGYGNAAAPLALINGLDHANTPGSLGRPAQGVEISIRANGESGVLYLRGNAVSTTFLGAAAPVTPDAWLRTEIRASLQDTGVITPA